MNISGCFGGYYSFAYVQPVSKISGTNNESKRDKSNDKRRSNTSNKRKNRKNK